MENIQGLAVDALFGVSVGSASSLFKETGHDAKGIFRMLYNAISHGYFYRQPVTSTDGYSNIVLPSYEVGIVCNQIRSALKRFTPNVSWASNRIKQYDVEHQKIGELTQKIEEYGFWSFLCFWNKDLNQLRRERRQYLNMRLDVDELLQIAYYKFLASKEGTKEDFINELKEFLDSVFPSE